jgi:hypothetical protein
MGIPKINKINIFIARIINRFNYELDRIDFSKDNTRDEEKPILSLNRR